MRVANRFTRWLAFKLPRALCYWAFIRVFAYATSGQYGNTEVPGLTCMDAMKRWEVECSR